MFRMILAHIDGNDNVLEKLRLIKARVRTQEAGGSKSRRQNPESRIQNKNKSGLPPYHSDF
jgi:hypothetical protein